MYICPLFWISFPSRSPQSIEEHSLFSLIYFIHSSWDSLRAQLVKNPPAMQETWVRSLGWQDPLEKRKATHSSILAWRIPWTNNSPWSRKELDTTEQLSLYTVVDIYQLQSSNSSHPHSLPAYLF